ncbi:MAG: hypothetical protein HYV63_01130 [Candidatus Schekmanbacteria bacterium]|nr:hypothetical protein [Candidatus Schekmanbacteria bacterium]
MDEGSKLWWNMQVRHQAMIERWLRLWPAQSPSLREQLATALGVPLFDLGNGAAAIAAAPGYRSRGTAAVAVLQVMTEQPAFSGDCFAPVSSPVCGARPGSAARSHHGLPGAQAHGHCGEESAKVCAARRSACGGTARSRRHRDTRPVSR